LLHVGVAAGARRLDALGVVPHHVRITPADLVTIRDLRATSIERTWCDLAACGLTVAELVAAGDRALWRRDPRTTRRELSAAVARYDGRRGTRRMRSALSLLSEASDSAPESELRVAILEAGFPAPEVNISIHVGGMVIDPDLSWPSRRVAIEYEGDHHRTDRDQWSRDIRRQTMLNDAGWSVYRATAEDARSAHLLLLWLARRLRVT
jgi:very-short-patch-repair endonuclease